MIQTSDRKYIGSTISHYKILEKIGQGGMGVVYKAFDNRLRRLVAIKILHPKLESGKINRLRFVYEAQAASALNHPNICTVYDIGNENGSDFIVMEYIDGETLREILTKKGSFSWHEVVTIGIQVCAALKIAHENGILHRDIKSDNLMAAQNNLVKVMDFGLAKLLEKEEGLSFPEETVLSPKVLHNFLETSVSTLQGTASYMSPEEIRKQNVDYQSDIFSLGVVLYELHTGHLPFKGKTNLEVMEAILGETPNMRDINHNSNSKKIAKILEKALNKDPTQRFKSADELSKSLVSSRPINIIQQFKDLRWAFISIFIIFFILSGIFIFTDLFRKSSNNPIISHFAQARTIPITNWSGLETSPSFSPSGNRIVFSSNRSGNLDIWMKDLLSNKEVNLTEDSPFHEKSPKYSHDGKKILFHSDRKVGGLYIMDLARNTIEPIIKQVGHAAWGPNGNRIIYVSTSQRDFNLLDLSTFESHVIYSSPNDEYVQTPAWSNDANWIVFSVGSDQAWKIKTKNISNNKNFFIKNDTFRNIIPVWAPHDKGIFFRSDRGGINDIWYQKISLTEMKPIGDAIPITFGAQVQFMDVSANGEKIAYSKVQTRSNIFAVNLKNKSKIKSVRKVTNWEHLTVDPSISPDGTKILMASSNQGNLDMWICNKDGSNPKVIYRPKDACESPSWSPDGKNILFVDGDAKEMEIKIINIQTEEISQLTHNNYPDIKPSWSPDGKWIVYTKKDPIGRLWITDVFGKNTRKLTNTGESDGDVSGKFSPDGKWVAYSSDHNGVRNIWVVPFGGGKSKQITFEKEARGGFGLCWSPDSKLIYYTAVHKGIRNLWKVSTDSEQKEQITFFKSTTNNVRRSSDICTDGNELYFANLERIGDIWLIENK